jgi:hypothetical protein
MLPVRSPLPNNVPSIQSAPAAGRLGGGDRRTAIVVSASSPECAALCHVAAEIFDLIRSRRRHLDRRSRLITTFWPLRLPNVDHRVAGNRRVPGSVPKLSGEYSNVQSSPAHARRLPKSKRAPLTAIPMISSLLALKTCSLHWRRRL